MGQPTEGALIAAASKVRIMKFHMFLLRFEPIGTDHYCFVFCTVWAPWISKQVHSFTRVSLQFRSENNGSSMYLERSTTSCKF